MTPLVLIDTPVPVIDHVTVSFTETDPNAVWPSLIDDNTKEVLITGSVVSTTFTVLVAVPVLVPSVALYVNV